MPDGHCADPSLPLHLDQGRGSSKKESFSLRMSPALHPLERPSPRRADMAGHGHGSGDAGTEKCEEYKTKCHEEVLYLQPLIPPKRFDISPPLTGGCSEGLGAF